MPDVASELEFLADIDLYKTQRPFIFTPSQQLEDGMDIRPDILNTVELELKPVKFQDIRDREKDYKLGEVGFEVVENKTQYSDFASFVNSDDTREKYRAETESLLKDRYEAEAVVCYSVKLRHNGEWDAGELVDLDSYGWLEPPARGAHVDFTFDHAPSLIINELRDAGKEKYLVPGYRYRVVNTWRPLVPVLEDNPLGVCDARSIDIDDLVVSDRILPNEQWSLYFLKHNPEQRWYWLSNQTPAELFIFMMYDTQPGGARYCCHAPFINPLAPKDALVRKSVETRSVIITKE